MLNLNHITKEHFAIIDPVDINTGMCCHWAWFAKKEYPKAKLFDWVDKESKTWGHAFVKIDDYYYDSEAPIGVTDWHKLGFIKRLPQKGYSVSQGTLSAIPTKRFRRDWNVSKKTLEKKIRRFIAL